MRHDRGALVHRRANSAEVVPVVVGRHDVANGLARDELFRLRQHSKRTRLVVRSIHHDDVILHCDGKAVMRSTRQVIDSFTHLLRIHTHRRRRE